MAFPYSFSITQPNKPEAWFRGSVKTQSAQRGHLVTFCSFSLYYGLFSYPVFRGGPTSLAFSEEIPLT